MSNYTKNMRIQKLNMISTISYKNRKKENHLQDKKDITGQNQENQNIV